MKIISQKKVLLVATLAALFEVQAEKPVYTRLDSEALEQKSKEIVKSQAKPADVTSVSRLKVENPLTESTLLSANGLWTFVPKGSVIYIPSRLSKNIISEPQGKFLPFPEFLRKNFGWLATREISLKEAIGDQELKESVTKAMVGSGRVVVAMNNKTPISAKISPIQEK